MLRDIIKGLGNMEEVVRDNVCYRQAMINFSSMIRARRDPAILCQGSEDCEAMIKMVYNDIRNRWDEDSDRLLQENTGSLKAFDAMKIEEECGSSKAVNIVLLGAASNSLPFSDESWMKVIGENVKPKFVEMNRSAFIKGQQA